MTIRKLGLLSLHIIPISMLYGSLKLVGTHPVMAVICGYLSGVIGNIVTQSIKRRS